MLASSTSKSNELNESMQCVASLRFQLSNSPLQKGVSTLRTAAKVINNHKDGGIQSGCSTNVCWLASS